MMPPIPEPSILLLGSFLGLLAATVIAALFLVHRYARDAFVLFASLLGGWIVLSGAVAASGLLTRWELRPPPALVLFLTGFVLTVALSQHPASRAAARVVPLAALIGFQAFRVPLEWILHRAYVEGLMPVQMSYAGSNFDVVTGILAVAIGVWGIARPISRWMATFFNLVGLTLLFNIVGIAIASTPAIAAFGPDRLNVWVTKLPFVWLPTVFVLFALYGHLLLMGRLAAEAREAATLSAPDRDA